MNELNNEHLKKNYHKLLYNCIVRIDIEQILYQDFCILVYEYLQFTLKAKKEEEKKVNILQHL